MAEKIRITTPLTEEQHHIRVEDDEPVAVGPFCTVVTALSGSAVLLGIIMQSKDACVFIANILARFYRPVLHNNDLEILKCLVRQAFE